MSKNTHKFDGSALGTSAKFATPCLTRPVDDFPNVEKNNSADSILFDRETGEIFQDSGVFDPVKARLERFALQSVARSILRYSKNSRVARCLRVVQSRDGLVDVVKSVKHCTCNFKGLQTCASVWACPICSAKISERRKLELIHALDSHKASGGDVLLLTLTSPHYLGDVLDDVLAGQALALHHFNAGANVTKFNRSIGLIGQIRALEVTHGRLRAVNNGWHPHYHILLFVDSGLDLEYLRGVFFERWVNACLKAGLKAPSLKHGIRLDDGSKAAAYCSKWGLESEMTKGHIKKANDGETPFDLLRAVLANKDKQAAALFKEFAETFKGKRQLRWSPGLKDHFSIADFTDELLASFQDDSAIHLGSIEPDEWRLILKYDLRGDILELGRFGWEPIQVLICDLRRIELHLSKPS